MSMKIFCAKSILPIFVAISVVLIGAVLVFVKVEEYKQIKNKNNQEMKGENDETKDWLTYKNDKYNYSIKYPQQWFLGEKNWEDKIVNLGQGDVVIISSSANNDFDYSYEEIKISVYNESVSEWKDNERIFNDLLLINPNYIGSIKVNGVDCQNVNYYLGEQDGAGNPPETSRWIVCDLNGYKYSFKEGGGYDAAKKFDALIKKVKFN